MTTCGARSVASCILLAALFAPAAMAQRYTCASDAHGAGATKLGPTTRYTAAPDGFGWDLVDSPTHFARGACSSDKPFFFSTTASDGNYQVTLDLGSEAAAVMTIKAESRRLMVLNAVVPAGGSRRFIFNVNVRTPEIGNGDKVRLKPREIGALDWDNKLTIEFNGDHPGVRSISIRRVDVPTIYIAGDSTVVDQDKEPWAAWGQMLPVFFDKNIAIANHAESGETIKSFTSELRFEKLFSTLKKGDYLMMQFAHNDQKPGAGFVSIEEYKQLIRRYEAEARHRGATTILVTSMNRRAFDADGHIEQTLGDYPQAMREVAAQDHLELINLNAMSKTLFEAMGPEGTLKAFVHYPANTFPDQPTELKDNTHFNAYGAYELTRCIVQDMRAQHLPLARYLDSGIPPFDPAHPDPVDSFHLPPSPFVSADTPYGR
jgi:lysophospholipase L1-like esterase